jgi:predicted transcriptional regulator
MTREQYSAQMMRDALDSGGRSDLVLAHFLESISPEESTELRKVLRRLAPRKGIR